MELDRPIFDGSQRWVVILGDEPSAKPLSLSRLMPRTANYKGVSGKRGRGLQMKTREGERYIVWAKDELEAFMEARKMAQGANPFAGSLWGDEA